MEALSFELDDSSATPTYIEVTLTFEVMEVPDNI